MRLGLSQLNLNRCGRRSIEVGSEKVRQLSYAYRLPLMASTIRYRLIASKANGRPNLP